MDHRRRRGRASWLVALIVAALIAACTGSTEGSGSGRSSAGAQADASAKERVDDVVDGFLKDDPSGAYANVRAVLVFVGARPLVQRYNNSSAEVTSNVFSVTKSVISILVGIALDEGDLRGLDQTLAELLPDYAEDMAPRMAGVTLGQVLTMTAGFPADGPNTDVTFFSADDLVAAIVSDGLEQSPGEGFAYASVGSHLLSAILAEATGRSVLDYARERLFDPLGIHTQPAAEPVAVIENLPVYEAASFAWPVDPQGHHRGDALLKISAPDMAKLGRLMLAGGRWDGKQIVSTRWVTESTRAHVPVHGNNTADRYGYQWWIPTADGHHAFAASGFGGQLIEVVPDLDLVVVISSSVPDGFSRLQSGPFLALVDTAIAPALAP